MESYLVNATHRSVVQGDTIGFNFSFSERHGEPRDVTDMTALVSKSSYHSQTHRGEQLSLGDLGLYDRKVKLSFAGRKSIVGYLDTSGMDPGTWRVQLNIVFDNLTSISDGGYLEVKRGLV